MCVLDPGRFPRLAEYIARLPEGLDSYPECRAKGTLVVTALEGHDLERIGDDLPPQVLEMLRDPPATGIWVPGTMSDAVFYAIVDAFYPTEEEVFEWTRERTRRTSESRLYRALARVASPKTLLRMASAAHGLFQRGTELDATYGHNEATIRLTHPPHLHGGLNHRVNCPMFEEVLLGAGATQARVEMVESDPELAVYEAKWIT